MRGDIKQKEARAYLGIMGMVVAAALIIILSTQMLTGRTKRAADETTAALSRFYLEEIAERTVFEINTVIGSNTTQLERAAQRLSREQPQSEQELRSFLAMVQELNGLDMFAAVGKDGMVYTAENTFSGLSRFGFLSEPITGTRILMTKTGRSGAMLLIAMPTEAFAFESTQIVSCITGVDVDKVISSQQLQGVNNQVLCRLFDGTDGTCIVESEGKYADGGSIFDVWANDCTFSQEYPLEKLMEDWQSGMEGYSSYISQEGPTYLYYKPVPGTSWMVSARLREGVISQQITQANAHILNASRRTMLVVILVMVVVLMYTIHQVGQVRAAQYAKEKEEELLRKEAEASERQLRLQERLLEEEKASGRQASVLQVLSKEYTSVFYVSIGENTAVPIRLTEYDTGRYGLKVDCPTALDDFLERYSRDCTEPEQGLELRKLADPAHLEEILRGDEIYTYLYRVKRQGQDLYAQIRLASTADRHAVMGIAIVDETVRAEQEQQRLLKEALAQAESANRAKTAFLNNMSHDIRTPMNAIIGYTNIALKQDITPEMRDWLEKIGKSSDHLLTLINDVLDISRIESGKVTFNPVPVDITTVTDTVLDIMNGFLAGRNLDFRVKRIRPENPYVLADTVRIREVLVNILGNAVKFTEDGGTITLEITPRIAQDDRHGVICYRVTDTGIGMSPEYLAHIFEEFSQEESGARTQYRGSGLGMSITKHYVDIMGGTITVESRQGVGSCFTVELPVELTSRESVEGKQEIVAPEALAGVRVLLAEDNDLNAEIATVQMEDLGLRVTRARNGQEAVHLFQEAAPGSFDMILMDIMMPLMNGYEAARAIRALDDRPDGKSIPIIAMTANAFAEDIQASLNAGMNAHLSKPVEVDAFIAVLAKYLNR